MTRRIYTTTSSPFQTDVESLFCTKRGDLRKGAENGWTSRDIGRTLADKWMDNFKDETTYYMRISSALSGLQNRLLLIRTKFPAIFGYFRCHGTPFWYVAKYPERPHEVMDIISVYDRRSNKALHTIALIESVKEYIDRSRG